MCPFTNPMVMSVTLVMYLTLLIVFKNVPLVTSNIL